MRLGFAGLGIGSFFSLRVQRVKTAGNTIKDVIKQHAVPVTKTLPRLCKPRCDAIIMLPNPTNVVSVVIKIAVAVDKEIV